MAQLTETPTRTRSSVFVRLAERSYRLRWWALLAWLTVMIGVTVGGQAVGSDYYNDFTLPGTESQEAIDTLRADAPADADATVQVVLQHPDGLAAAPTRERVAGMLAELTDVPSVRDVASPYASEATVSPDGTIGYATVTLDGESPDVPSDHVRTLIDTAQAHAGDDLRVELGGDPVRAAEEGDGPPGEMVGLLAALLILVLLFGSLLAASLPIIIAVVAVVSTLGLIVLASHLATIADFTPPLMMLVGLGVGIDYALLIFARYRGELIAGAERDEAARHALDTAGRTVFFAACTTVIALFGLVALGLGALQGVAVAVALTVLMTMVASLTLLPALLAIVGRRVERAVRRRTRRRARREARGAGPDGGVWRRWVSLVQRSPWLATLLTVGALLALAAPALGMRLGFADAGTDDPSTTSRQSYDLLAEGFGPGFNGPLAVVVDGDREAVGAALGALDAAPGVADAFPAGPPPDGAGVTTVIAVPEHAPQDEETAELVTLLREDVLPPVADETGATYLVGGTTAAAIDFADAVAERLLVFVIVVLGLSALLLMMVFRSVLIPLKAAVLNLLSVGASLGVLTLVFQNGVMAGALGIQPGPVEAFLPVMIFAIVFGLSMDYEMFLLSRMHEEWQHHHDASRAIREGLANTGRIVAAAAAIMVVVFGAFMLSPDRMIVQFGLGLAVAILVDAAIVRFTTLPAIMQLLGRRAWWLPRALDRALPRVALERERADTTSAAG
ncbi:MMPL family transporter [Haloechinothrix sp. LS1_15]|uniref:MMPL family transporter n=1 Tax=Haloechinothrix sp. LS1_15 TaxID=2652248 RepID=UPI00294B5CFA|nr:MMPL family transporter [Haloechinothrix sp. LS1_15]